MPGATTVQSTGRASPIPLTAVVVHWNAPEWCAETVASLRASVGVTMRIVVVDNSAGDHPYVVTGLEDLVIERTNDGFSGGANAGLHWWRAAPEANDEHHVLVASHDAIVAPEAVRAMCETMIQLPWVGLVGVGGGSDAPATAPTGHRWSVVPRPWVSGSLLLLSRAALDSVGLFDERLPSYVEDVDLSFRCWDAGLWTVVVDDVRLRWHGSRSAQAAQLTHQNWLRLSAKRRGTIGLAVVSGLMLTKLARTSTAGHLAWRSSERRRTSKMWAHVYRSALTDGWRTRTQMLAPQDDTVRQRNGEEHP
ncbi:MAG: glycosyltransferase family 2 protein [Actinomycetota bacterium]